LRSIEIDGDGNADSDVNVDDGVYADIDIALPS
jgi:hypothetical protein